MKKEEFLRILRKNLSVLEEGEIQDIVEEYEQHIDMKMKEGLTEEAAIKDFGDLQELTTGILEAYHVKADYKNEVKKNIDFGKVKEESKKATEKATDAIGKGAGALGKCTGFVCKKIGATGKWVRTGCKKLWQWITNPFTRLTETLRTNKEKVFGKGIFSKLWMFVLSVCGLIWRGTIWCVRFIWNVCWAFTGFCAGMGALASIFLFGTLIVLQNLNYPVLGIILFTVGFGLICGAITVFCFSILKRKKTTGNIENDTKNTHSKNDVETFQDEEERQNVHMKQRKSIWKKDMYEQDMQVEEMSAKLY